jgi:hypothetical protein
LNFTPGWTAEGGFPFAANFSLSTFDYGGRTFRPRCGV